MNNPNKFIGEIVKASQVKAASVMSSSKFFKEKELVQTPVPALNVALSGKLDGGLTSGLLQIAGPSKHFKSLLMLIMAKAYMDKYPDSIMIFYDSEFGTPLDYLGSLGIDPDRVAHIPVQDVEELKHSISNVLDKIEKGQRAIICLDSIGNLASRKETEDALDGKSVADMTRAKAFKSFFRIVTSKLTIHDIPMVVINHTYKTLEMYSKDVVGGGTGSVYGSNDIWIMGREQEKDGKELQGYNFKIKVFKSRFVKEGEVIPITVSFEKGLDRLTGIFDMAEEGGFIVSPKQGVYALKGNAEETFKRKAAKPYLEAIVKDPAFAEYVKNKYKLANGSLIKDDVVDDETLDEDEDEE